MSLRVAGGRGVRIVDDGDLACCPVIPAGIKASVKNGELTLVVPKKHEAEPKKIEVHMSE